MTQGAVCLAVNCTCSGSSTVFLSQSLHRNGGNSCLKPLLELNLNLHRGRGPPLEKVNSLSLYINVTECFLLCPEQGANQRSSAKQHTLHNSKPTVLSSRGCLQISGKWFSLQMHSSQHALGQISHPLYKLATVSVKRSESGPLWNSQGCNLGQNPFHHRHELGATQMMALV